MKKYIQGKYFILENLISVKKMGDLEILHNTLYDYVMLCNGKYERVEGERLEDLSKCMGFEIKTHEPSIKIIHANITASTLKKLELYKKTYNINTSLAISKLINNI